MTQIHAVCLSAVLQTRGFPLWWPLTISAGTKAWPGKLWLEGREALNMGLIGGCVQMLHDVSINNQMTRP